MHIHNTFQTRVSSRQLRRSGPGLAAGQPQPGRDRFVDVNAGCADCVTWLCQAGAPRPRGAAPPTSSGRRASRWWARPSAARPTPPSAGSPSGRPRWRWCLCFATFSLKWLIFQSKIILVYQQRFVRGTGPGTRATVTPGAPCCPPSWGAPGPWWGWPASGWTAPAQTSPACTPGESEEITIIIIIIIILVRVDKYLPWIRRNMWE